MPKRDVYSFPFSTIYSLLVDKVERKGRGKRDVDAAINWIFGYSEERIEEMAHSDVTYYDFLLSAPSPNPKRLQKKGRICGIKVEELEEGKERDMRILDLMMDELAKGKTLKKIFMEE